MEAGFDHEQAWEMVREQYLFRPPEPEKPRKRRSRAHRMTKDLQDRSASIDQEFSSEAIGGQGGRGRASPDSAQSAAELVLAPSNQSNCASRRRDAWPDTTHLRPDVVHRGHVLAGVLTGVHVERGLVATRGAVLIIFHLEPDFHACTRVLLDARHGVAVGIGQPLAASVLGMPMACPSPPPRT